MAKIVYILGAGFSRPLGLPLVHDFIEKAREQFHEAPDDNDLLRRVLQRLDEMALCHRYYDLNLHNIEDMLSLLEMQELVTGDPSDRLDFVSFIRAVIKRYTPPMEKFTPTTRAVKFPPQWTPFGAFVSGIFGLQFGRTNEYVFPLSDQRDEMTNEYAVITLNYDTVLEQCLRQASDGVSLLHFGKKVGEFGGSLVKLHGCIDAGNIIAPTWNKNFRTAEIVEDWRVAFSLLSAAQHIRVIGYSLPDGDSALRYLLRAAALKAPHFKSFDVVCKDDKPGTVKARYDALLNPNFNYRFSDTTTQEYLKPICAVDRGVTLDPNLHLYKYLPLEFAHRGTFPER